MIRHVFFSIRLATGDDFKDANKCTKYGAVYFIKNADNTIGKKIYYLQPETNKVEFKALFDADRIYTFANADEVIKVDQCTVHEWNEEFPAVMQEN